MKPRQSSRAKAFQLPTQGAGCLRLSSRWPLAITYLVSILLFYVSVVIFCDSLCYPRLCRRKQLYWCREDFEAHIGTSKSWLFKVWLLRTIKTDYSLKLDPLNLYVIFSYNECASRYDCDCAKDKWSKRGKWLWETSAAPDQDKASKLLRCPRFMRAGLDDQPWKDQLQKCGHLLEVWISFYLA